MNATRRVPVVGDGWVEHIVSMSQSYFERPKGADGLDL